MGQRRPGPPDSDRRREPPVEIDYAADLGLHIPASPPAPLPSVPRQKTGSKRPAPRQRCVTAASARRSVSRTVEGVAPRYEIALWPSPSENRYLKISRTRRMLNLSAAISVLSSATQRKRTFNRQSTRAQPSTSHGWRNNLGIRGADAGSRPSGRKLSLGIHCRRPAQVHEAVIRLRFAGWVL
jgi:hypothetical protein